MAEKNYFFLHPERTQMLFLSCLEKPRSLEEVSIIYKVPTTLFYRKNFLTDVVERGIFKLDYIGRKPFLYSLFTEEFKSYFETSLKMVQISKEIYDTFVKDEKILIPFFDSSAFRGLWKEEVLRTLNKNHFKEPLLITSLFTSAITLLVSTVLGVEKYKIPFNESKNFFQLGKAFLSLPNVPLLFADKIIEAMNEKEYPHYLILKGTNLYKLVDRTAQEFLKTYLKNVIDLYKKVTGLKNL
jgi:hypothetical protein